MPIDKNVTTTDLNTEQVTINENICLTCTTITATNKFGMWFKYSEYEYKIEILPFFQPRIIFCYFNLIFLRRK